MPRGRKPYSIVRKRIIDILFLLGKAYGYEIYKIYNHVFPKVSQRLIYYHLRKGAALGEIKINKITKESGNFSWGDSAEKIYYEIGENANPRINLCVKKYLKKIGRL